MEREALFPTPELKTNASSMIWMLSPSHLREQSPSVWDRSICNAQHKSCLITLGTLPAKFTDALEFSIMGRWRKSYTFFTSNINFIHFMFACSLLSKLKSTKVFILFYREDAPRLWSFWSPFPAPFPALQHSFRNVTTKILCTIPNAASSEIHITVLIFTPFLMFPRVALALVSALSSVLYNQLLINK